MKCQTLFSGKNKKNIINLSSAENAQRVVKVKSHMIIKILHLSSFHMNFMKLTEGLFHKFHIK